MNNDTVILSYDKYEETVERHTHLTDEEIEDSDGYIVVYPYGQKSAPIVSTIKGKYIYLTIDRDCYEIEKEFIQILGDIAEIYFDTEDVTFIREYLAKNYNKIKP